jgi:hypothetical protein
MLGESDGQDDEEFSFDGDAILDLPTDSEDDEAEEYSDNDVLYEGDDAPETEDGKWGRSKKVYYSADKEALEEEASEAKKIQKKRLENMRVDDFTDGKNVKLDKKSIKKGPISLDFDDLEYSDDGSESAHYSEEEHDDAQRKEEFELNAYQVATLSAEERMELLEKHSDDFKALVTDFKGRLGYLESVLQPVMKKLESLPTSEGLEFLKVKYQLLTSYCTNVAFYLQLKLRGKAIMNHPVLEKLVKFRLLLEKIKPMELKLKNQIDRLLKAAAGQIDESELDATKYKPNPELFAEDDEDNDSEEEKDTTVYKAPKLAPVHYPEDESAKVRRERHEQKMRTGNASSRLIEELRAEYEDAPEEEALDVVYGAKKGRKEIDERDQYEEENYVRFTLDKKAKQRLREQTSKPIDEMEDLNDFVDEISGFKKGKKNSKSVAKFVGKSSPDSDGEAEFDKDYSTGSKRKSPAHIEDESDIEDDLGEDEFYSKAKATKQAKKDIKSRPKPQGPVRFQPIADLNGSQIRPANRMMLKNKGLTERKPKEYRNPRVRQRMRFEKAEKRLGSYRAVNKPQTSKYGGESTGIRSNITRSTKF